MAEVARWEASKTLRDAIAAARCVIAYAAGQPGTFDEADVQVLLEAETWMAGRATPPSVAEETRFWSALQRLNTAIAPATIDSVCNNYLETLPNTWLSDTVGRIGHWMRRRKGAYLPRLRAQAERLANTYRWWARVCIALLVATQIYIVVGNGLVRHLNLLEEETKTFNQAPELEAKLNDVRAQLVELDRQKTQPLTAEESLRVAGEIGAATELESDLQLQNEISDELRLASLVARSDGYLSLYQWGKPWRWVSRALGTSPTDLILPSERASPPIKPEASPYHPFFDLSQNQIWALTHYRDIVASALTLRDAFTLYLMPLMAGFIGAIAFVLRNLETEIRGLRLRRVAAVGHSLRVTLGGLAGAAIGWFTGSGSSATPGASAEGWIDLGSLAPAAIGFLAGYSIELLFAAIDRFLGAFGAKPSGEPAGSA